MYDFIESDDDSSSSSSSSSSLDIDELEKHLEAAIDTEDEVDFCDTMKPVDNAVESEKQYEQDFLDKEISVMDEDVLTDLVAVSAPYDGEEGGRPDHDERMRSIIAYYADRVAGVRLTHHDRTHMQCYPELNHCGRLNVLADDPGNTTTSMSNFNFALTNRLPYRCPAPILTPEERNKKVFTVSMQGGATLLFIIENYVHVTYFVNSLTGDLCKFSLRDLSTKMLDYFVEYSCKKFAKVNLRLHDGLSFLLYTSSVLVETGSDNQLLSRRLLQHVITILRERCGYPHINIKRRKCQNIVATGKLNYYVCMNLLKHKFQAAREKDRFPGLVIKHRDLVKFFNALDGGDDGYECVPTPNYINDDDDSEIIAQINAVNDAVKLQQAASAKNSGTSQNTILNEYGEQEDEEEAFQRITKLIDEYDPRMNSTRLNGTFILFREGQVISTGCKTDRELVSAMPLLARLTHMCSESNPENRKMEAALVASQRRAGRGS